MKISEINSFPSVISNVHESCYRSYQLLEKVKEMLTRGDSHETILEIIKEIENSQEDISIKPRQC